MNQEKLNNNLKYIMTFLLLCILFFLIPYTDDDLRWGSSMGMERFREGFQGYGGRYVGYMIIMSLTRFRVVKVVLQSFVLSLLLYLLEKFAGGRKVYYLSVIIMFFMPIWMKSQTIAWAAGFANYVTSVTFTLIYMVHIYRLLNEEENQEKEGMKLIQLVGYYLLAIVNSLIVEHFTMLNICLVIFALIYSYIKYKKISKVDVAYLLGIITGVIAMFSNPCYGNVFSGSDSYRHVARGGMLNSLYTGFAKIANLSLLHFAFVILILAEVMILAFRAHKEGLSSWQKLCAGISVYGFAIGAVLLAVKYAMRENNSVIYSYKLMALAICMVVGAVLAVGIISFSRKRFFQCMLPLVSILILDGQFLFVNPVTPRCFFGSYIMFIVLVYQLMILVPEEKWTAFDCKKSQMVQLMVAYIAILFNLFIYARIYGEDKARNEYVRKQAEAGNKIIGIERLSLEEYVHDITLKADWEWDGYKEFYGIDMDVEIVVIK